MRSAGAQRAVLGLLLGGLLAVLPSRSEVSLAEYRARRDALRQRMSDGIVVLFGNSSGAGSESYFVFRQESNFYYLSGWAEPGAVLLVAPESVSATAALPSEILFLPARKAAEERWTGPQLDPREAVAAARTGSAAVRENRALETELRRYGRSYKKIYTLTPNPHASEPEQAVQRERIERLKRMVPGIQIADVRGALGALRQIKSPAEIALIRQAVECSVEAHLAAGRAIRPGLAEYEIAAVMKYTFERAGCTNTAFDPIIAAGPRSTILHYTANRGSLEAGALVVLDVGAEFGDYSADLTRTLPVNGKFTPRQREVYETVLGAQKAVLAAIKPGMTLYGRGPNSLHQIALDYLNRHGQDRHGEPLGKYFLHGIGHGVGLDVHDPLEGPLQPGMVLAIEPGLYLPEENIGVRIEDNVLVTENGAELLSGRLPREVEEIERWMQQSGQD